MSVRWSAVRQIIGPARPRDGNAHEHALLIYNPDDDVADQAQRPIDPNIAAVLARPDVADWSRLHDG